MGPYERECGDETHDYQMVFVDRGGTGGEIGEAAFESALGVATSDIIVRSHVAWIRGREWCWTPVVARFPSLDWSRDGDSPTPPGRNRST